MRMGKEKKMSKEYIEREAAIEAIMSEPPDAHYPSWYIDRIKTLSAADVAPVRHGRWRWITYDANPKIGNWHCTYCNRIPKSFQKEDFCPNCGAYMMGENNGKCE